jgi:citrate lyase subunit beta / citryl-CoA lyase
MRGTPRSWMFVPGNRPRFIDKGLREVAADTIFLDLEDGVPTAEKPAARKLVAAALAPPTTRPLRYVRVNRVGSDWFREDMRCILVAGLDGICLPKVEQETEVLTVAEELHRFERESGLDPGHIRILAAIESARGLLAAPSIAACSPRVVGLIMGTEDFALDLGLGTKRDREARELLHARSALVIAAASAHRQSIDGVFPDLDDDAGLVAEVEQARRLGFTGKSTFHPKQVDVINRVFSPAEDEIAYARTVVSAFDAAQARGDGAVAVGGQLVDLPIVARAQRLLRAVADAELGGN